MRDLNTLGRPLVTTELVGGRDEEDEGGASISVILSQ